MSKKSKEAYKRFNELYEKATYMPSPEEIIAELKGTGKKHRRTHTHEYDYDDSSAPPPLTSPQEWLSPISQPQAVQNIPLDMMLTQPFPSGVTFGMKRGFPSDDYIGMPHGKEGNIIVIGGNGSGKSASVAKPTIVSWKGTMCVTDTKGELSKAYADAYQPGKNRPYLIFDPMCPDGPSYDPFGWLLQDGEENLISNIQEMVLELLPSLPEAKEPFWYQTEQAVFEAALLYCFKLELSFSESICKILNSTMSALCKEMLKMGDATIQCLLGEISEMKPETLADVDRGLRNKLMRFATDPYISHAFRGEREGAKCFTWADLGRYNIFLRIPAERIEQWGKAINLMYAQLFRHLERRPDKYGVGGRKNIQTLLLMDEFPRFGKLDMILSAITTLRSKNVNICLIVQSLAQLDKLYGENGRRIILDNCQYQVILRSNDAETQQYLSNLIGVDKILSKSASCHLDESMNRVGYSEQVSEGREPRILPHELATLNDVLLLTPDGFFQLQKIPPDYDMAHQLDLRECDYNERHPRRVFKADTEESLPTVNEPIQILKLPGIAVCDCYLGEPFLIPKANDMRNEGAKMLTIEERTANAEERIAKTRRQRSAEEKTARDKLKKLNDRRNYILGELLCKYFPELMELEPGTTKAENAARFASFENFLSALSDDTELMDKLKERARRMEDV